MMRQQLLNNPGELKMALNLEEIPFSELISAQNYNIDSLDSEIRADRYCTRLLKHFHLWLLEERRYEALDAGKLAAGADYFLREFMIGARRQNIFSAGEEQLRQFGGNWYIISNLEPNSAELEPMLLGTALFYAYGSEQNLFNTKKAAAIEATAGETSFFSERIEGFHRLEDDGYTAWDQACALR